MTVRIVHKNSVAEDKRPTAGQLANGEIAVNLHEAGAFLSIKDTAGNVQQVGGVKVAQNSPANPVKGTFWLDSDNNTLFIYDGTQWRGVTGGGGGGGGSINLAEGDAINITQAGSTYTINVVAGAGITLAGDNVAVELDTDATTVGLKMVGAGDAGKLSAKVATASTLGSVKVDGTTITVDGAGEISAILPDPLTYKGNINPTTEDGGADAIPTGSVGDAYTCSWGGTNVEGNLDNSPDWLSAIKGGDTTATLGDLLIINSGDGSGANEWTLVKTGTVDSGASIDVGDGTTASFPPASPAEGDVWYNTDDGRTYVYITDSSGDTVWVDVSPQGNQTLWKSDTAGIIEPQTNTDNLRIPALTSNSTTGTRIGMLDTNGTFVANTVGDGLEIETGVLKIRDSGAGAANLQFVTDIGNTTTNNIQSGGNAVSGAAPGVSLLNYGSIEVTTDNNTQRVFTGYTTGGSATSEIRSNGSASFASGNISLYDYGEINVEQTSVSPAFVARATGGNADSGAIVVYPLNDTSSVSAAIKRDGSAEFVGGIAEINAFGGLTINPQVGAHVLQGQNGSGVDYITIYGNGDIFGGENGVDSGGANAKYKILGGGTATFLGGKAKIDTVGGGRIVSGDGANDQPGITLVQNGALNVNTAAGGMTAVTVRSAGTEKVSIGNDGSADFAGEVNVGDSLTASGGVQIREVGSISSRRDGPTVFGVYTVYNGGNTDTDATVSIKNDGTASFAAGKTGVVTDEGNMEIYRANNIAGAQVLQLFSDVGGTKVSKVSIKADGSASFVGTVTDNTSDIKFKKNVKDAPTQAQLDDIKELKLRTWQWREGAWGAASRQARHQMGLVAQEAERVDPNLAYTVEQGEDESFKAIDHKVLTMKLLGALQEATTRIEALEAEVAQLKGGSN